MKKFYGISLLISLFLVACDERHPDSEKAAEEIRNRKIRHISEGEIMSAAEVKGIKLVMFCQKNIAAKLEGAVQKEGMQKAMQYCVLRNYPFIDSLEKAEHVLIRRTSDKLRNPMNKADSTEASLFAAYQYNYTHNISTNSHPPLMEEKYLLFTAPIVIETTCMECHGVVGKDISEENYKIIKAAYPQDQAINYKPEQLRGMWSIRIDKKELIRGMK
jgi:hypothetical protein